MAINRWLTLIGFPLLLAGLYGFGIYQVGPWAASGLLILAILVGIVIGLPLLSLATAILPVRKVPIIYNLRNLQVRWKTTAITALAFTMVVALLTIMLAFVRGMSRLTEESGHPGNVMILAEGSTDEVMSNLPPGLSVEQLPSDLQAGISRDEKGNFLVTREVYVIVNHMLPNPTPGGRKRRFVQMRGLDSPTIAAKVHGIELEPGGEWFRPGGVRQISDTETAFEAVLGDGVAKVFGQDKNQSSVGPGEVVEIGNRRWYVTGVMKPNNTTFGSEIWTSDQPIQETFGRRNSYSTFVVRTENEEMAKKATTLLKDFRSEKALEARTQREYYANLNKTNAQFLGAAIFVAVFMGIGGVFGVMNTMFAAVSQRAKDIGVLRLLGYTRWQVLMSFLMEALVIAFLGGGPGLLPGLVDRRLDCVKHCQRRSGRGRQERRSAFDRGRLDHPLWPEFQPTHGCGGRPGPVSFGHALEAPGVAALKPMNGLGVTEAFRRCLDCVSLTRVSLR